MVNLAVNITIDFLLNTGTLVTNAPCFRRLRKGATSVSLCRHLLPTFLLLQPQSSQDMMLIRADVRPSAYSLTCMPARCQDRHIPFFSAVLPTGLSTKPAASFATLGEISPRIF
jgi:hypothetical protein